MPFFSYFPIPRFFFDKIDNAQFPCNLCEGASESLRYKLLTLFQHIFQTLPHGEFLEHKILCH